MATYTSLNVNDIPCVAERLIVERRETTAEEQPLKLAVLEYVVHNFKF